MLLDEKPIVFGTVVDHAGKPVADAEVKVRLANQTASTITNANGGFLVEFDEIKIPGYYLVNTIATFEDKMGISRIEFQVKGDLSVSSQSQYELETFVSQYYNNYNLQGDSTDSLESRIIQRYQQLEQDLSEKQKQEVELKKYQEFLEQQRETASEYKQQRIEEFKPGSGTYSGWKYERFVEGLDENVREIIVNQLNYTINAFSEAQMAMEKVLQEGGTMEEARKAYFVKATIPRKLMENFVSENSESDPELQKNLLQNTTSRKMSSEMPKIDTSKSSKPENKTVIDLDENVTSIILKINGVEIELEVNGTQIYQIPKADQNQ